MKSRFVAFIVLAAAATLLLGGVCGRKLYPPEFISVPSEAYAGDTVQVRLATHGSGYDSVRYVVNWDDVTDTTAPLGLFDTATVSHVYTAADTKHVRAAVFSPDDPQGIRWGAQKRVAIDAGGSHAPVIDTFFFGPQVAVKNIEAGLEVRAHDPDGDSVRFHVQWGDNSDTVTDFFASPCSAIFAHAYTSTDTFLAVIEAEDVHGARSQPESVSIVVGTAGGVMWYWWDNDEDQGGLSTEPLLLNDGDEDCIYAGCEDDGKFYAIRASDGRDKKNASTRWPGWLFTGHPAFCAATQHIIVGSDEGELYALNLDLSIAWQWPDKPLEESLTFIEWGAPAIKDNRLYVPHDDDSLFYFIDSVDHGVRVAAFTPHAAIIDAPVIDAQGNVCFGTDSGNLYKMGPELDTVFWRTRLIANGEIHSPIVGGDGTIYCASESFRVYAVDPVTGTPLWVVTLDGEPFRLAVGQSAVFVGTDLGNVCAINPATGTINWEKTLSPSDAFSTAPAVAANGYVYLQSDADVLFCVNQADGTIIWSCNCPRYLPRSGGSHNPRKMHWFDAPSPLILPNGNIIVVGDDALYCVAGYPEGPLDPHAPWPKWQHDVYNTGYVHGGP